MEGGSRRLEGWFVSCQATLAILTYTNQGGFTVGFTAERRREITFWYDEFSAHFFMWRNSKDPIPLVEHFDKYLKHLLL